MNIHEYQAKEILQKYGVPVPGGKVAFSAEEAENNARESDGRGYAYSYNRAIDDLYLVEGLK